MSLVLQMEIHQDSELLHDTPYKATAIDYFEFAYNFFG